ncbi:uncharacterized protein LOC127000585 isoform X2 [Eriocheir sinensis]|uniref:uncharacterized protein LOC127000585 isoform X2 n=1 Tax=Eriocheir sinensis TaxID=95602 RepID=UPI0021C960F6|nr:uncharacterized protein LOC127000585 isoform X2 [Eriocheir sinensis]XP_050720425.1 uncharacterized protein LOC127000585 isoform X2 [Eriocheir sinensis]
MATWAAKSAIQGSYFSSESDSASCLSSAPSSRPPTPTTTTPTTPTLPSPSTPSPDTTIEDCMEDSGFQDWMAEMQLGVTGDMSVVERLNYLLDTGQFADVNIRVGQGNNVSVFKAHRLLLATASQPLYRLVQQATPGPGPNDMSTLRITDMKPVDFENILKYIYTDQVACENISVAFALLRASRKWGLAGLGIKSLTYLEEFVDHFEPTTEDSKDNLFDLLVLSEDTLAELNAKCWQILLKNSTTVIPCNGYLNLDKPMVQKVICHPDLKIEDQLKLFEAIRDWGLRYIDQQGLPLTALGTAVEELIKAVDFEKISDSDFLSTVLTSECLGKAEVIAFFMTHGLDIPRKLDFNNNKQLPFWLTFCATSGRVRNNRSKNCTKRLSSSSSSTTSSPSSLAPVSEALTSICSLTQNGSVLEFNKVCRFKKGYRCPPKEIYQEHELRFRVDKNVKLLGVGFGFLFTPTDMGLNIHCQGPWETRQWTDIIQSYVRFSGEKTETADVRLMFLHPVRIEANQSYKVVVKMVRMSHGSNEVELWGGTGGVHCVETEDAEFSFIKAAVDPDKRVEEEDGDTKPGVITELLYRLDTGDPEPPPTTSYRRRRPQPEEEVTSPPAVHSNPWRQRARPDSLRIPENPYSRRRSPGDEAKTPESTSPRRRERPPVEEYKPTSFSTNRWARPKPKEEVEEYKPTSFSTNRWARPKPKEEAEEYKPSSFSTNRWARPKEDKKDTTETPTERKRSAPEEYRPSSFSTNRWARPKDSSTSGANTETERKTSAPEEYRPSSFSTNRWARPREDGSAAKTEAERKTSAPDEYNPSSFSTNRWSTKPKEEEAATDASRKTSTDASRKTSTDASRKTSTDASRKTSTEDSSRWRTRPQEEAKDTPFGARRRPSTKPEDTTSSHPFARRRESRDSNADVPFFLRKTDDSKPPTASYGRSSRLGSSFTTTTGPSSYSTPSATTTTSTSSSSAADTKPAGDTTFHSRFLRPSGSSAASPYSSSRYGSVRESSLSRLRDTSLPRYTSSGGYLSRYDSPSDPPPSRAAAPSSSSSSRYGSGDARAASPHAPRKNLRYGTAATSSGSNLLALSSSSFGLGGGGGGSQGSRAVDRYGGVSRYDSSSGRYGSTAGGSGRYGSTCGPSSATAGRYGLSSSGAGGLPPYSAKATSGTAGPSGRYSSRGATDTLGSTARYGASGTARHGSGSGGTAAYSRAAPGSRYGSSGSSSRYTSPAPAGPSGR